MPNATQQETEIYGKFCEALRDTRLQIPDVEKKKFDDATARIDVINKEIDAKRKVIASLLSDVNYAKMLEAELKREKTTLLEQKAGMRRAFII